MKSSDMDKYTQLLTLIPQLKNLNKESERAQIHRISKDFVAGMSEYMVVDYQQHLSQNHALMQEKITSFDEDALLAYLTYVIRMDRFVGGILVNSLQSGWVLVALEHLASFVPAQTAIPSAV